MPLDAFAGHPYPALQLQPGFVVGAGEEELPHHRHHRAGQTAQPTGLYGDVSPSQDGEAAGAHDLFHLGWCL